MLRNVGRVSRASGRVVATVLVAGALVAGCGRDGSNESGTAGAPTTAVGATGATIGSTAAPTSGSTPAPSAAPQGPLTRDWVGTIWRPGAAGTSEVVVDGQPSGLFAVTSLCQGDECGVALDLVTDAPTGAAPAPGPYLVWSSRMVGRSGDGAPIWQVVAQEQTTLAEGESSIVCTRVGDPTTTALGIARVVSTELTSLTPSRVWVAGPDGSLESPDPATFACETGQD